MRDLMIELWQSACQDKPLRPSCTVQNGNFVLAIQGNRENWTNIIQAAEVPAYARQVEMDDTLTAQWGSLADAIFGADGLLSRHLDNYEVRPQQLWMGRMVQRAIEMGEPAVIEAGTGTGKSFAYAAICMAMGKRVAISTSNKALQMQLYRKDIPFLQKIFPNKKVVLVQGKRNYVCKVKAEDQVAGMFAMATPELRDWYIATETGNTEEIPFAVDWQELAGITADENCTGKMCARYMDCHYYLAKAERASADVLITNHMLLCLDQLYPGAGILPGPDVLVIDEAQKLADYARNALGVEFTESTIHRAIVKADGRISVETDEEIDTGPVLRRATAFSAEMDAWLWGKSDYQIGIPQMTTFEKGQALHEELHNLADEVWNAAELPAIGSEVKASRAADTIRNAADAVWQISEETRPGHVRFIDRGNKEQLTFHNTSFDVSEFIGAIAGFRTRQIETIDHAHCRRCGRTLTADTVAILDNAPYGPDCIRYVDPFGDAEKVLLSEWLDMDRPAAAEITHSTLAPPTIFTSATLAAPDMAHFMREAGLPHALQMKVDSPFDYQNNAVLYIPNGTAPAPSHAEYGPWLTDQIRELVTGSQGGAFLLFTSYANMHSVRDALRPEFEREGHTVLVQGELPKLEIAKRFAADGNAILFATKSFFEGVSIDGAALRLVVIDKMPFEAPSPLGTAQEDALRTYATETLGLRGRQAEWYPFEALRVPKMVIELKQGTGRLIRTANDWGAMAILDGRIRSAQYGRRLVLPSLPAARLVSQPGAVADFFQNRFMAEKNAAFPIDKRPILADEEGMLWV